jgi:glycosyltransferase involved in cell wall biosynthesis
MNISVVIATYNGEQFIKEQLDSIAAQTLLPSEVVICDDASSDTTVSIIKSHILFERIKLVINDCNIGLVENFKKAVTNCNPNNYIAFCDQDDIWFPNKLKLNFETISKIEKKALPSIVYSDSTLIDKTGKTLYKSFMHAIGIDKYKHNYETVLFGSVMLGCTMMINPKMRSYFLEIPNEPSIFHDAWMALVGFAIGECIFINQPLVYYKKHSNNITISKFEKTPKFTKLINYITQKSNNVNYLNKEIILAMAFFDKYENNLTELQKAQINKFINLKNRSFIIKKFNFEYVFFKFWLKRF